MKRLVLCAMVLVLAAGIARADTITHGSTTVNMDFVTVGNPGNTADTEVMRDGTTGYGAASYFYQIGKYEVTADQWAAVVAADPSVGNAGYWTGSQPTAGTSWHEAAKFCNWLTTGNANSGYYAIAGGLATPNALSHFDYANAYGTTYFIPTEDEWYKAAYFNGSAGIYYDYPTGSDNVPVGIRDPQVPPFDAVFFDGYYQGHPNAVTNAGVASPYGTIGQGGNVQEWNEAAIRSERGSRGGEWYGNPGTYMLEARTRGSLDPMVEGPCWGFRVASIVPEPGSISLAVCIAVVGLLWRRRRR